MCQGLPLGCLQCLLVCTVQDKNFGCSARFYIFCWNVKWFWFFLHCLAVQIYNFGGTISMVNVQIATECSLFDRFCFWCIVCLFWWNYQSPWKSYITVDTMQKQNMNWFSTVLRVLICFIILTDLTEFSVEVLCGWSVWSRRSRCEEKEERQELKLGDARGTPSKYSRRLKRLSLGMPQKASPLSSTSIGMFSDSFHSCNMCRSWSVFCI